MLRSLSANFRSLFTSSANDNLTVSPGTKRKRICDEYEDDPDVQIVKVEKKRKLDSSISFVDLFKLSASKMADWARSKSQVDNTECLPSKKESERQYVSVSSRRNGSSIKGTTQINGDNRASRSYRSEVTPCGSYIGPSRNGSTVEHGFSIPFDISKRWSNSSSSKNSKPSTASMCIRLNEKKEYQRLIELQTHSSRSPWQTSHLMPTSHAPLSSAFSVDHSDSDVVSVSSKSSSCDTSLFGTTNILTQNRSATEPHFIPRYKKTPSRTYISSTNSLTGKHVQGSKSSGPDRTFSLASMLYRQRKKAFGNSLERPIIISSAPDEESDRSNESTTRLKNTKDTVNQVMSRSPTIIIDDDEEENQRRQLSRIKETDSTSSGQRQQRSTNLPFLNSVYTKDQYLEDFQNSRRMEQEQRKRQIEEQDLKAKAYAEKRRAQELSLERKLKYQMRIFEEEPEVSEEIFRDEEEEEEDSLPELTNEMQQVIQAALRGHPAGEVLSEAFRLQITRQDMTTLGGLNWLNDEVINFYMNMLMDRGEQEGWSKAYAFNTFFYPKIMSGGHSSVKRWTKKVDIFAVHYILIPVHLGMHWCLCVADMKDKVITYYDSMGGRNSECLEAVRRYINDESIAKKQTPINMSEWSLVTAQDIPQQMNGSDCGMFTCKYAEYITRGKKISFSQEDMPYFRRRMVYEIISKKLLQ